MILMKTMGLVTLAALLAAPVAAKTWTCSFSGPSGAIPEQVIIKHNESTGTVSVTDPFIRHYVGAPVSGRLKSVNAARYLFQYKLPSLKDSDGDWVPGISFTVNIIRATGAASLSSQPNGNYKAEHGSGTCR